MSHSHQLAMKALNIINFDDDIGPQHVHVGNGWLVGYCAC
jgi:uncharacterized ferritin-like protein (DUF455 family)